MKQIIKTIFLFLSVFFIYSTMPSCIKEDINMDNISDSLDWPLKLGAPVAYGDISLKDIIEKVDSKGLIKTGKDGLLYVLYRDTVFSQAATDLLPIPSQNFSRTMTAGTLGIPGGLGIDSVNFSREEFFDFSVNKTDAVIDSMFLKSGNLSVNMNINFPYPCRITVTFPKLKRNGVPFRYTFVKSNTNPSYTATTQINLTGYKMAFETVSGVPNKVRVNFDVAVINSDQAISSGSSFSINASINSAGFSSIFGYLGQLNILNNSNEKITLDLFDASMENMNIEFDQPKITAFIHNSFGLPVRVGVNNTKTYSEKTSTYFPVTFNPSLINIKYPRSNEIGKIAHDTIAITSNFFDAIKTSPHYFFYDVKADANPDGIKTVNFFTDTSRINIETELNLPLKFKAENLSLPSDTSDFDAGSIDFSKVKQAVLNCTFTNSIPFDLNAQIFLTDENYMIIDQLFLNKDQPLIKSGTLTNSGKYTFSAPKTVSVIFDGQKLNNLEKAKHMIMKFAVTTAGNGQNYVAFYSDYIIKVAFQLQTELYTSAIK